MILDVMTFLALFFAACFCGVMVLLLATERTPKQSTCHRCGGYTDAVGAPCRQCRREIAEEIRIRRERAGTMPTRREG